MIYEKLLPIAGTTGSAILAGFMGSISWVAIQPILLGPSENLIAIQWRYLFQSGHVFVPLFALFTSICHFTNAWCMYTQQDPERGYWSLLAGLATISTLAYTLILVTGVNTRLFAIEKQVRAGTKEDKKCAEVWDDNGITRNTEVRSLVRKWSLLNAVRVCLPLTAALLSFNAL